MLLWWKKNRETKRMHTFAAQLCRSAYSHTFLYIVYIFMRKMRSHKHTRHTYTIHAYNESHIIFSKFFFASLLRRRRRLLLFVPSFLYCFLQRFSTFFPTNTATAPVLYIAVVSFLFSFRVCVLHIYNIMYVCRFFVVVVAVALLLHFSFTQQIPSRNPHTHFDISLKWHRSMLYR